MFLVSLNQKSQTQTALVDQPKLPTQFNIRVFGIVVVYFQQNQICLDRVLMMCVMCSLLKTMECLWYVSCRACIHIRQTYTHKHTNESALSTLHVCSLLLDSSHIRTNKHSLSSAPRFTIYEWRTHVVAHRIIIIIIIIMIIIVHHSFTPPLCHKYDQLIIQKPTDLSDPTTTSLKVVPGQIDR